MRGRWDSRITLEITGLHEISGSDYGIEEPYIGNPQQRVLPTKNPGGTLTTRQNHQIDETKLIFSFFEGSYSIRKN